MPWLETKCNNTTDADVKYASGSTCAHATYLLNQMVLWIELSGTTVSNHEPPAKSTLVLATAHRIYCAPTVRLTEQQDQA